MSDAEMNYEHTKRNVKVPHGWRIVADTSAMDVVNNEYHWWNPTEGSMGAWLKLDATNAADMEALNTLYHAGATCFIERDPNPAPIPPPPPAFLSAPAPVPVEVHAPSEVAAPPSIPVAPPAPVFAPPAPPAPVAAPVPVVPVAAPVIPVAPPAPPAPPAFVAPAPPVVIPPVAVAPVVPAVPVVPVVPVIPVAPVAAPVAPVAAPIPAVATDSAPESAADENEVDAWLAALDGVKDRIKALEAVKADIQKKIVAKCFPNGLREGANNCALPDGRKLTITGVINRTFDDAMVPDACAKIVAAGGNPEGVFVTKLAIGTAAYKALDPKFRNLLADCVTEKDGTPQFKVTEPKK